MKRWQLFKYSSTIAVALVSAFLMGCDSKPSPPPDDGGDDMQLQAAETRSVSAFEWKACAQENVAALTMDLVMTDEQRAVAADASPKRRLDSSNYEAVVNDAIVRLDAYCAR